MEMNLDPLVGGHQVALEHRDIGVLPVLQVRIQVHRVERVQRDHRDQIRGRLVDLAEDRQGHQVRPDRTSIAVPENQDTYQDFVCRIHQGLDRLAGQGKAHPVLRDPQEIPLDADRRVDRHLILNTRLDSPVWSRRLDTLLDSYSLPDH